MWSLAQLSVGKRRGLVGVPLSVGRWVPHQGWLLGTGGVAGAGRPPVADNLVMDVELGQEGKLRHGAPPPTFHLARAKFFSIWAQTPSLMFLSEAALPEILGRQGGVSSAHSPPKPPARPSSPSPLMGDGLLRRDPLVLLHLHQACHQLLGWRHRGPGQCWRGENVGPPLPPLPVWGSPACEMSSQYGGSNS